MDVESTGPLANSNKPPSSASLNVAGSEHDKGQIFSNAQNQDTNEQDDEEELQALPNHLENATNPPDQSEPPMTLSVAYQILRITNPYTPDITITATYNNTVAQNPIPSMRALLTIAMARKSEDLLWALAQHVPGVGEYMPADIIETLEEFEDVGFEGGGGGGLKGVWLISAFERCLGRASI